MRQFNKSGRVEPDVACCKVQAELHANPREFDHDLKIPSLLQYSRLVPLKEW
jgi:hypothetical protein